MPIPPRTIKKLLLSDKNIEQVENDLVNTITYGEEGKAIEEIFEKYKENNDISIIMMKICLIDFTNGTNINKHRKKYSLYELAKKIKEIPNFDSRVSEGDSALVNELAKCRYGKDTVNLFSFASKYCHYHNRFSYKKDDYSIYDSVVAAVLPKYFSDVSATEIKNWKENYKYEEFNEFIYQSISPFNIKRVNFDHFLWFSYKDLMPIRIKKDSFEENGCDFNTFIKWREEQIKSDERYKKSDNSED